MSVSISGQIGTYLQQTGKVGAVQKAQTPSSFNETTSKNSVSEKETLNLTEAQQARLDLLQSKKDSFSEILTRLEKKISNFDMSDGRSVEDRFSDLWQAGKKLISVYNQTQKLQTSISNIMKLGGATPSTPKSDRVFDIDNLGGDMDFGVRVEGLTKKLGAIFKDLKSDAQKDGNLDFLNSNNVRIAENYARKMTISTRNYVQELRASAPKASLFSLNA